jgi:hypothetical protein
MPSVNAGNWVNVAPGDPAFNIMSNMCDFFELGAKTGDDLWLVGEIIGPEREFIFNGRLFLSDGRVGTVIDSFPRSVPKGWTRRQALAAEGYDLVDDNGDVLFGYRVDANHVCHVTVNLYRADGSLAAHGGQAGLVTHGLSVRIGRGGILIGGQ